MGIHPTHLDMHMGTLAARPDYYAALIKVAHEYHLPFLAVHVPDARDKMFSMLSDKDILLDSLLMFDTRVPASEWTASYVKSLAALKPGMHLMIVHLGYDDAELQAITEGHPDYGAAWRERDLHAVESPEFKKALEDNHIIVIGWKDLKKVL